MKGIFSKAFETGIQQWRIATIVYAVQFCLALTLGMEVHNVLGASIGKSLEINKLLEGYDHTVFSDFLKIHGASLTPLIGQLRWLLCVWLFFSVFIDAGLLYAASEPQQVKGRTFWKGGARYFFVFLKIDLLFLLMALIWSALILVPIALFLQPALEHFISEIIPVWGVIILLLVYVAGLVKFFIWSVLARVYHIRMGTSVFGSLKSGLKIFWSNKWALLAFTFGFFVLQILLFVMYWWLESMSGMTTALLIAVFFVLQQAFVFFRIQIRQMVYAGIAALGC
jgi:hypothetical protein